FGRGGVGRVALFPCPCFVRKRTRCTGRSSSPTCPCRPLLTVCHGRIQSKVCVSHQQRPHDSATIQCTGADQTWSSVGFDFCAAACWDEQENWLFGRVVCYMLAANGLQRWRPIYNAESSVFCHLL